MKYTGAISSKGQVTSRWKFGAALSTGDRVDFVIEGERTVIQPARSDANPFEKYKGILGTFPGGENEIKAWISDLRNEEE